MEILKAAIFRGANTAKLSPNLVPTIALMAVVLVLMLQHEPNKSSDLLLKNTVQLIADSYDLDVEADQLQYRTDQISKILPKDNLAYIALIDTHGNILAEKKLDSLSIPLNIPKQPQGLTTAIIDLTNQDHTSIREYLHPLRSNGAINGFVRIGYHHNIAYFWSRINFTTSVLLLLIAICILIQMYQASMISKKLQDYVLAFNALIKRLPKTAITQQSLSDTSVERQKESINRYIDELKNAQESLSTMTKILSYKRTRMESVLKAIPFGAILLDESGTTSFANEKIDTMLGISHKEIIGKKPSSWCQNLNVLSYLSKFERDSIHQIHEQSVEFKPEDANEKTISVSAYPLFSSVNSNDIFGTMIILRDVTQEIMAQSNRADFVAHMSHELKTPLNVLAMYSESLFGEEGKDEAFRIEASNVIHDEIERMSTLINNLLSITKIEMGDLSISRQRVRLRDLLEDAFNSIARNASNTKLIFDLQLPNDFSPVCIDKDLIRIAINNLLTNAIKYNHPNGKVSLSAEEHDNIIQIKVKDTGIGIQESEQDYIFDKFFRSNEQNVRDVSGHGLGLALTKQIIDLHHGSIAIDSTPGSGTEFTIELRTETELLKEVI